MSGDFNDLLALGELTFPSDCMIREVIPLNTVDSTNSWAKRYIQNNSDVKPSLIIADYQSAGRGRFDRTWISPSGTGLWFSVIIEPHSDPREWFCYSLIPAIVTAKIIRLVNHLDARLKWPNDVLIRGKKCCGILIEALNHANRNFLVIGTGINVNQEDFPDEIRTTATSLFIESQSQTDRKEFLIQWIKLFNEYGSLDAQAILNEWRLLSCMLGHDVVIQASDQTFGAVAIDIASDGGLIIERDGNRSVIYAGDVHLKIT